MDKTVLSVNVQSICVPAIASVIHLYLIRIRNYTTLEFPLTRTGTILTAYIKV